ncbi:natterin-3-like [Anopheles bellator]|uniref:natterin-3-like n=1 Tax=Anopheles bellator TaxID=139047 RepID=UPI0026489A64|nr:natterin-3-like [Anopheles bellator]
METKKPHSSWQFCSNHTPIPPSAILAGHDSDGSPIYVGRANHNSDQLPGKVLGNKHMAYVGYHGKEIAKQSFDVLCDGNVSWVSSGFGVVPPNAVLGGRTSSGEGLYVGRAHYKGSLASGKIHPSHQTLYITFGGKEISVKNYEVLIEN